MADLVFVVITIAFFVVCVGYVRLCDRIIGPDPADPGIADDERELVAEAVGS
jgi:hypothetical protein